jgi:hypothetical protein
MPSLIERRIHRFLSGRLPQPNAGSATVLVDELDAANSSARRIARSLAARQRCRPFRQLPIRPNDLRSI